MHLNNSYTIPKFNKGKLKRDNSKFKYFNQNFLKFRKNSKNLKNFFLIFLTELMKILINPCGFSNQLIVLLDFAKNS